MDRQWHVYKIEVDGVLIYIGSSDNVEGRRSAHRARQMVPRLAGKVSVMESFATRAEALKAENAAIRALQPVGNFRCNTLGYKTLKDRDRAMYAKLNELEAARWRRIKDEIEATVDIEAELRRRGVKS